MKYLFIIILFISQYCSGQSTIDSLPKASFADSLASIQKSIALGSLSFYDGKYVLLLNQKNYMVSTPAEVLKAIEDVPSVAQSGIFYIIKITASDGNKLSPLIQPLRERGIKELRLLDMSEQAPPDPVVIETPRLTVTPLHSNDSSNLVIHVKDTSYQLTFAKKSTEITKIAELDDYLAGKGTAIKSITVKTAYLTNEKRVLLLLEQLKKYKKYKLNLEVK